MSEIASTEEQPEWVAPCAATKLDDGQWFIDFGTESDAKRGLRSMRRLNPDARVDLHRRNRQSWGVVAVSAVDPVDQKQGEAR